MTGIKDYDFSEIERKAKGLRELIGKIEQKLNEQAFLDLPKETYDVLINYKFAPLIATICDERINTWDALCIPWYFLNKIGSLDAETIVNQDISAILKSYFDSGQGEFPSGMSDEDREKWIRDTSLYIKGALDFFINRDTNPIEIFIRPENPEFRAVEVYFMLRRISGIGPKSRYPHRSGDLK